MLLSGVIQDLNELVMNSSLKSEAVEGTRCAARIAAEKNPRVIRKACFY